MKWRKHPAGVPDTWTHEHIVFYDLIDDNDELLGYVREDKRTGHGFTAYTNRSEGRAQFPTQSTLKAAQDMLLAHFVLQKLEDE